jgi:hypothetical protein
MSLRLGTALLAAAFCLLPVLGCTKSVSSGGAPGAANPAVTGGGSGRTPAPVNPAIKGKVNQIE